MKLIIDIPKNFEKHFYIDRFEVSFHRLFADVHSVAGLYERELVVMLIESFKKAKVVDDATMNELAKERWIPCSERLPEINKVVLITNKNGNVSYGQFRGTYGDYWRWRKNTLAKVTAWMPLPEPYGGDSK